MGSWSISLFRIRGIKLEVHLTFLILWGVFAFMGWSQAGWAGIFWFSLLLILVFVCVVLHELGHSLTAQSYGIPVSRILLLPIGGMAQFERIPRHPRKEIIISLAGPAVNVALALLLFPLVQLSAPTASSYLPLDLGGLLQTLLIINIVMGVFNLLPIFPMDGGRVLRALLALKLPYLQATTIAAFLAKGLAIIGVVLALFNHFWMLGVLFAFIYFGGGLEYRMVKRREKMSGLYVGDLTRKHFLSLPADAPISKAALLFEAFRPGEILVMDGDVPKGYLTTRIIRRAVKNHQQADPVQDHCIRKFSVLQAGWPLDPFVEMISQSNQRLYPVYSFGALEGVLDTKNLENLIAWHRMQERLSRPLAGNSEPKEGD